MDVEKFTSAYHQSRNGASQFFGCSLYPAMQYSDGVKECAEAGCYWLLDIIGTECIKPMRQTGSYLGTVTVTVTEPEARITLSVDDSKPIVWGRYIDFTDMPEGEWKFLLAYDTEIFTLFLLTEH